MVHGCTINVQLNLSIVEGKNRRYSVPYKTEYTFVHFPIIYVVYIFFSRLRLTRFSNFLQGDYFTSLYRYGLPLRRKLLHPYRPPSTLDTTPSTLRIVSRVPLTHFVVP